MPEVGRSERVVNHYGYHVSAEPPNDPDPDDSAAQRRAVEEDMRDAKETLERVRREMPYRRALWGFRLYYIGLVSAIASCGLSYIVETDPAAAIIPIALPLGVIGYLFGYLQVRHELRLYMNAASSQVWHSRRDRKSLWQAAIFRDAFMGRVRDLTSFNFAWPPVRALTSVY